MDRQLFKMRIRPVAVDVVDADEPRVFGVGQTDLSLALVQRWMAQGHVVGDRPQIAAAGQSERAALSGQAVAAEKEAAVVLPVGLLQHLTLSPSTGPSWAMTVFWP